jgi:hypothetical protein
MVFGSHVYHNSPDVAKSIDIRLQIPETLDIEQSGQQRYEVLAMNAYSLPFTGQLTANICGVDTT